MTALKKYIVYGVILLPIAVFYSFNAAYNTDIPWFDDIENIPFFLSRLLDAPTWYARAEAFLRPNNEHRVLSARLLVYLDYFLTGKINFRYLNFAGNLTVLGIFLLVSRAYLKNKGRLLHLIPAAFFIFNLQFYSMTFMTIMSMQYQLIIFEVFLGFYLLTQPSGWAFTGALAIGLLGTFSMGNGMMIWPTGVLFLLYLGQWQRLTIWTGTGIAAIVGYFSGYAFVQGNDEGFTYFFNHPLKVIIGFFAFVGGIWDWFPRIVFEKRMLLPVVGGFLIMTFFLFYVFGVLSISARWRHLVPQKLKSYYAKTDYFNNLAPQWGGFWVSCFIYLLINCAMVVFFRTRFDYQLVLWATYKIYPGTLMAMTAILALHIFPLKQSRWLLVASVSVALLSWVSSYWFFVPQVTQDRKQRLAFAFNQQRNEVGLGAEKKTPFATYIVNTLRVAEQKGFYRFPNPLIHGQENELEKMFRDTTARLPVMDVTSDRKPYGLEVYNDTLRYSGGKEEGVFVALISPTHFYLFSAEMPSPFQKGQQGFRASCPEGLLYDDTYQIGIWVVQKEGNQLWRTRQSATLP